MATESLKQGLSFDPSDARVQKFIMMQLLVVLAFSIYTTLLFHLSTLNVWTIPQAAIVFGNHQPLIISNKIKVSDIWFALFTITSIDAFWVAATFNRALIKNWHYFVSLRMMAIASLVSFLLYLYETENTAVDISQYPMITLIIFCGIYLLFGSVLQQLHKPPPATALNAHFGSIQSYSNKICQSTSGWKSAIQAASVIGILPILLTVVIPQTWATIIPLVAISFESIFLAFKKVDRGPEYTLCGGTFLQAVTCAHWGLPQVVTSPRLAIPAWAFLFLLLAGRLILDLHMHTVFYKYPDLLWTREQILSTKNLVYACIGLQIIEYLGFPVVSYVKLIAVPIGYSFSVLAVAAPASYGLAFDKAKVTSDAKKLKYFRAPPSRLAGI